MSHRLGRSCVILGQLAYYVSYPSITQNLPSCNNSIVTLFTVTGQDPMIQQRLKKYSVKTTLGSRQAPSRSKDLSPTETQRWLHLRLSVDIFNNTYSFTSTSKVQINSSTTHRLRIIVRPTNALFRIQCHGEIGVVCPRLFVTVTILNSRYKISNFRRFLVIISFFV